MYKIFLLLLTLIFSSSLLYAMQIDYEKGKQIVLDNNLLVKAYKNQAEAAKYRYYQAKGEYLPDINLSETYTNTDEPANAAFSAMSQGDFDMDYFNNKLNDPDRVENYETKLEILQPVFMKGKIYFGIKQAEQIKQAKELTAEKIKQKILLNYTKSFFGLSLAEKAMEVTKKSYERMKKYYNQTDDFYQNGMVVKSDLLIAENYLLENKESINEAKKQLHVVESSLQRLLDTDESIEVTWTTPDFSVKNPLNKHLKSAYTNRQDFLALDKYLKSAEMETKKSRLSFMPELSIFANYKQNSDNFLGNEENGVTFGAKVSFNLFNGFSDYNKVKENKNSYLYTLNKKKDMKRKIKHQVKQSYYSIEAAKSSVEAAKKRVEAAYEALEITQNRFSEGIVKVTELLDREVEVKKAELNMYKSQYDLITSKAELLFNTGKLK